MEPEVTSKLKASFGEYEELGKEHKRVSDRIAALQEAMKFSRQSGAFQALQNQMREVKALVKQKEDLDAKMAVADLARKKDDDHRLAVKQEVSYSEQLGSVSDRIEQLASLVMQYSELSSDTLDFARCQRPDGSFYGTRGKCKKGTEAGTKVVGPTVQAKAKAEPKPRATMKEVKAKVMQLESAAKQARSLARQAERQAKAIEKETRGDKSIEARKKRIAANSAWDKADRMAERAERVYGKAYDAMAKLQKKAQLLKMSPEQRKAERALDREIRMRG